MNWEAIGAIGEIVGAGAVVVTLGYLAVQIRHSMNATKIDSRQRVLDRYSDALGNLLAPDTLDSMRNGLHGFDDMSGKDQASFTLAQTIFANNLLNALRLRDEGTLDEETLAHISNGFVGGCRSPGGRQWWEKAKSVFPPSLVKHVDHELTIDVRDQMVAVEELLPTDGN